MERIDKNSMLGQMKLLEVGRRVAFPIEKLCTIRVGVASLNKIRGYKSLRTSVLDEPGSVVVIRIA